MKILGLIGLCLLIYITVMVLLIRLIYQQIGSTCGFYSLVYGISKVQKINRKKAVKKIIIDCINSGESFVGEIFDITLMEKISKNHFPDIKVEVVEINGTEDLDRLLEDNYIVYTCNHNKTPHYCFLENKEKTKYIYRHGSFRKNKISKEKCYQWHEELKSTMEYEWKNYYHKKVSRIKKVLLHLGHGCMFLSDPELYLFLKKNKQEKRILLYGTKTQINMFGKVLIIPRTKIPVK